MNYKVSVIMPVYNAENELEKTIQSVINQSIGFENIELILIDDNSLDNSKKIIEKYFHITHRKKKKRDMKKHRIFNKIYAEKMGG